MDWNFEPEVSLLTSDFVLAGLASMGGTFFTNPIEVIKTRIQLQGELSKRGTYNEPYRGVISGLITVGKNEGMSGLQKGIVPALWFQFIINSFRLSIYTNAVKNGWIQNDKGEISFSRGLLWGAFGGVVGAFCSSPFFLIKTQLQAQAADGIAVGYQHKHNGMIHAFRSIYKKGGFLGLWKGAPAAVPRACIGSGAQIATYGWTKSKLKEYDLVTQPTLNSFCGGLLAGSIMAVSITPPDVITTRLYNQHLDEHGRGLLYKGWLDCLLKTLSAEGVYGLYKGFWANYMRFAPHSTLAFIFFEELRSLRDHYKKKAV